MMSSLLPATVCAAVPGTTSYQHVWVPWGADFYSWHLWFVSLIMVHGFCFPPLFNVIRHCSNHAQILVLAVFLLGLRAGLEQFSESAYPPPYPFLHPATLWLSETSALWQLPLMILGMLAAQFCKISPQLMSISAWWWLSPIIFAVAMAVEKYEQGSRSVYSITCWCLFMLSSWGVKAGQAKVESGELWQFLNSVAARLGRYSWGAYLYQALAFRLFQVLMPDCEAKWLTLVPSLLAFVLGWLSDTFLDTPILNHLMRRLRDQTDVKTEASPPSLS